MITNFVVRSGLVLRTLGVSTAVLVAGAGVPALAAGAPPIYVDGTRVPVTAIERSGRVFVPIRGVFERLGASVTYAPPSSVVARKAGADIVQLHLGRRAATIHGTASTLEAAPFLSHGRTFVPLRLISESAGAGVAYATAPRSVRITTAAVAAVPVAAVAARPVVAAPVATAAPVPAEHHGMPWWLWPLIALLLLLLLFALLRRRKREPVIVTRSTPRDADARG